MLDAGPPLARVPAHPPAARRPRRSGHRRHAAGARPGPATGAAGLSRRLGPAARRVLCRPGRLRLRPGPGRAARRGIAYRAAARWCSACARSSPRRVAAAIPGSAGAFAVTLLTGFQNSHAGRRPRRLPRRRPGPFARRGRAAYRHRHGLRHAAGAHRCSPRQSMPACSGRPSRSPRWWRSAAGLGYALLTGCTCRSCAAS